MNVLLCSAEFNGWVNVSEIFPRDAIDTSDGIYLTSLTNVQYDYYYDTITAKLTDLTFASPSYFEDATIATDGSLVKAFVTDVNTIDLEPGWISEPDVAIRISGRTVRRIRGALFDPIGESEFYFAYTNTTTSELVIVDREWASVWYGGAYFFDLPVPAGAGDVFIMAMYSAPSWWRPYVRNLEFTAQRIYIYIYTTLCTTYIHSMRAFFSRCFCFFLLVGKGLCKSV